MHRHPATASGSGSNRSDGRRPPLSRYDLVLAVIPSVFLAGLLLGAFAPIPLRAALVGASGLGAVAVIDALFLHPPADTGGS